ncbi:hypothetical protein MC378_11510 [Polaribacter sp. MSW13]|uniref:GLPGLI family protein n=1 Tax=Polaribacter marinus TaxID=2916838 RepID=A0A9X1VS58_9FLAO|nr:hypothetical protein [Polaribacter marinus]MCI2229795.1 hypothetical protein [Polaribacter marinus]
MKKALLLLVCLSFLNVLKSTAQDKDVVFENLTYVNQQFKDYNKYHTIWAVDNTTKELVCFDKFGSYRAKMDEIIIEAKDGSATLLNFKCKTGKCLKKMGETNGSRTGYSMNLSQKLSPVIEKLNAIIKEYYPNNNNNNNNRKYSSETKKNVKEILARVTEIFQTQNDYKNKWYVDWDQQHMYSVSDLCKTYIPLGKGVRIEASGKGYKFLADSKIIRAKCTSFDSYDTSTYNHLKTTPALEEVIYLFDEILTMTK